MNTPFANAENETNKLVCLRFDDGPRAEQTRRILEILEAENVKATFAFIGKYVEQSPEVVKETLAAGHEVANHSYDHPNMTKLSEEENRADLTKAQEVIEQAGGMRPKIFFAPFNAFDEPLLAILADMGMMLPQDAKIYPALDWQKGITAEEIKKNLLKIEEDKGYLLIHDWSDGSISVLPEVIQTLKQRGYRFVTAGEMHALTQQAEKN